MNKLYNLILWFFIFNSNAAYCQNFEVVEHKRGYNIILMDGGYHLEYIDSTFQYENMDTMRNKLTELYKYYKKYNTIIPKYLKLIRYNPGGYSSINSILAIFDIEESKYTYYKIGKNKRYCKKIKINECAPNSP